MGRWLPDWMQLSRILWPVMQHMQQVCEAVSQASQCLPKVSNEKREETSWKDWKIVAKRRILGLAKKLARTTGKSADIEDANQKALELSKAYAAKRENEIQKQANEAQKCAELGQMSTFWNIINSLSGRKSKQRARVLRDTQEEVVTSCQEYFCKLLSPVVKLWLYLSMSSWPLRWSSKHPSLQKTN